MSDATPRLALPLIASGQAQKEIFHNEALARIDAALQPAALGFGLDDPPLAPASGDCWIAGATPTGAWAGQAGALATWTEDGWRFVAPPEGMAVWLTGEGLEARYAAGAWSAGVERCARIEVGGTQVVGSRQAAIAVPSGGAVLDAEGRTAITAILAALIAHGLIAE